MAEKQTRNSLFFSHLFHLFFREWTRGGSCYATALPSALRRIYESILFAIDILCRDLCSIHAL